MFNFISRRFSRNVVKALFMSALMLSVSSCLHVSAAAFHNPSSFGTEGGEEGLGVVAAVVGGIVAVPFVIAGGIVGGTGYCLYRAGKGTCKLVKKGVNKVKRWRRRKRFESEQRIELAQKIKDVLDEHGGSFTRNKIRFFYDDPGEENVPEALSNFEMTYQCCTAAEVVNNEQIKIEISRLKSTVQAENDQGGVVVYRFDDQTTTHELRLKVDDLANIELADSDEGLAGFLQIINQYVVTELVSLTFAAGTRTIREDNEQHMQDRLCQVREVESVTRESTEEEIFERKKQSVVEYLEQVRAYFEGNEIQLCVSNETVNSELSLSYYACADYEIMQDGSIKIKLHGEVNVVEATLDVVISTYVLQLCLGSDEVFKKILHVVDDHVAAEFTRFALKE